MTLQILRIDPSTLLSYDISDNIVGISGLEWRRSRDYKITIPHPTMTIIDIQEINKDDEIFFKIDGVIKLKVYVDEVEVNEGKNTIRMIMILYDLR